MNQGYAVWAGPGEQATGNELRVRLHAESDPPAGPGWVPVAPYVPLGFAEAVAASLEIAAQESASRSALPGHPGGDFGVRIRNLVTHLFGTPAARLRRHGSRLIVRRFPQLGPPSRWRWPEAAGPDGASGRAGDPWQKGSVASEPLRSRLWGSARDLEEAVLDALEGRRYTGEELRAAVEETGLAIPSPAVFQALLGGLVRAGVIERRAGVGWSPAPGGWRCRRCGSDAVSPYPCYRCGLDACPQCDTCASIGRMTACTELYTLASGVVERRARPGGARGVDGGANASGVAGGAGAPREVAVRLTFPLTPQQERISRALAEESRDALVWAACGAGKTEVTYEAIRRAVAAGGRALFAVPRRDVVEQLGRRLAGVFSGTEVAALYGGTPERYTRAPIVVATVHQTLRFHRAFQIAVVDEVDAFPLSREPWLLDGLEQALVPGGRMIAMSATPSPALLHVREGAGWALHLLPARHHRQPLPVPETLESAAMRGGGRQGGEAWRPLLLRLVEESMVRGRRVLVFVPAVSLTGVVAGCLREGDARGRGRGRALRVDSVHARDPERSAKVRALEEGRLDVLVSTTVLERGVTVPFLDVVVFAADTERVWDAASLVQMAGRAGRSPADPSGRVVFLAARVTPAMREARETIVRLNRRAEELGLLDTVGPASRSVPASSEPAVEPEILQS